VIQPLTDYIWLGVHPLADDQLVRAARVILSLGRALHSLDSFYRQLNIPTDPTASTNLGRFFPRILSYCAANGQEVPFDYVIKLEDESPTKAIFKAKTTSGDFIVVKFVQTYSFAAHRLLASHGLAPRLLYPETAECETPHTFCGLKLVVMEFVNGETAFDAYGYSLPDALFKQVEDAISVLHVNGLVFGDLRPLNIMIVDERALLVDYDWCGNDGEGRYPATLNDVESVGWHPDVKRGAVMRKEHDVFLLKKLCAE